MTTGTYYLRLRTKDNAGNQADEWATLFKFKYDGSAPATPVVTMMAPIPAQRHCFVPSGRPLRAKVT